MKYIKKCLNSFLIGVGIGATTFLLCIALSPSKPDQITSLNIFSVLFLSGMVGILSLIFDLENIPFLLLLIFHFVGTFILMVTLVHLNNWVTWHQTVQFFLNFGLIYLFIWIYIKLRLSLTVKKTNEKIQERNKEKRKIN